MGAGAVVKVEILGDAKSALKAFDKVNKKNKTFSQKMGDTGKKLTKGLTLPILAVGGALIGSAIKTGNLADRLLDLESITGISTGKLQEMAFVAKQAGVSNEFYSDAVIQVTKAQDQLALGTGPISDAFDTLGIAVLGANGEMRSSEELTDEAMDALAAIEDPTLRAALAQDIFGKKFEDVLPVLDLTAEGIANAREEAIKIGAVMSKDALNDANEFRQGMETLQASVGGLVASLGAALAPALTKLSKIVSEKVVPGLRRIFDWFKNLPGPVKKFLTVIVGLAATIGPLLILGAKMVKMFKAVKAAFLILKAAMASNPWALLAIAIAAIVVLIITNWDSIVEFLSKIWEKITKAATAAWDFIKEMVDKALGFVKDLFLNFTGPGLIIKHWDSIKEGAATAWRLTKELIGKALTFVKNLFLNWTGIGFLVKHWTTIKLKAKAAFGAIKLFISETLGKIGGMFLRWSGLGFILGKWDAIKGGVKKMKEGIVILWGQLIGFLKGLPRKIKDAARGLFDGFKNTFRSAINWIIKKWNALKFTIGGFTLPKILGGFTVPSVTIRVPRVPTLAQGTDFFGGGLALVGERGRELVNLPRGSQVVSNRRTEAMLQRPILIQLTLDSRVVAEQLISFSDGLR